MSEIREPAMEIIEGSPFTNLPISLPKESLIPSASSCLIPSQSSIV